MELGGHKMAGKKMNTKLKKTALDDNADIYQHGTKSVTKEEIKKELRVITPHSYTGI